MESELKQWVLGERWLCSRRFFPSVFELLYGLLFLTAQTQTTGKWLSSFMALCSRRLSKNVFFPSPMPHFRTRRGKWRHKFLKESVQGEKQLALKTHTHTQKPKPSHETRMRKFSQFLTVSFLLLLSLSPHRWPSLYLTSAYEWILTFGKHLLNSFNLCTDMYTFVCWVHIYICIHITWTCMYMGVHMNDVSL